jgi:hypothetical protein
VSTTSKGLRVATVAASFGIVAFTVMAPAAQAATLTAAHASSQVGAAPADVQAEWVFGPNSSLEVNKAYSTPFGTLVFQSDGNLVVKDEYGTALWASHTGFLGKSAIFQSDGNFVVYDGFGRGVWASGTTGSGATLQFQGDGNLVIYDLAGRSIWASNTSHTY